MQPCFLRTRPSHSAFIVGVVCSRMCFSEQTRTIFTYVAVSFSRLNVRVLCLKRWGEGVKDKFPGAVPVTSKHSKECPGSRGVSSGERELVAGMRWWQPRPLSCHSVSLVNWEQPSATCRSAHRVPWAWPGKHTATETGDLRMISQTWTVVCIIFSLLRADMQGGCEMLCVCAPSLPPGPSL